MINRETKFSEVTALAERCYPDYPVLEELIKQAIEAFLVKKRLPFEDIISSIVIKSFSEGKISGAKSVLKLVKQKKYKELNKLVKDWKVK